jgi:hypothetical protein
MRKCLALIAFAGPLAAGAAFAAEGLTAPRSADVWPQWQARLTVSTLALAPVSLTADPTRSATPAGTVLSDYYFDAPGLRLPAVVGGVRATSGFMATPRSLALGGWAPTAADASPDNVPYLGVGYTGLSTKHAWGISADLGVVAENPAGAGRFGRAVFGNGSQAWDGALREMRFSPWLQIGVSYAF